MTGEVLHGRRDYREHMKRHNLGHADDYKETWQKEYKHREEMVAGTSKSHAKAIKRDLIEAAKKLGVL